MANEGRNRDLNDKKATIDRQGIEEKSYLERLHDEELRIKARDYNEKMKSDNDRYI